MNHSRKISKAPLGWSVFLVLGPSLVWCSEYIGSGEVILATRTGAILGVSVLWAIFAGIFLKYWIGMSGARYTVCTGEGMIDMFSRMPGPRNWVVWIVLVVQFVSGAISIGSIASAAGIFLASLVPVSSRLAGWLVTIFALTVAWTGVFRWLKIVMSLLVALVILGVFYVAAHVFPDFSELVNGLIPSVMKVPQWAVDQGMHENPWREVLPLLGWAAGGFASQVWYSYWVIGAGYGMAEKDGYGQTADINVLKRINSEDAGRIKGWCRLVTADATLAMTIGMLVTAGFMIAGAGILAPGHLAPEGEKVAFQLSNIFSAKWGEFGGTIFIAGGTAALIATQIGQLAGWPRLLADSFRICIPAFSRKFVWKTQFRIFLVFFFLSNMVIVYSLGYRPVFLVKMGAIMDGLLLTPFQAIWILVGLYFIMPRFFSKETAKILRPHWVVGAGLVLAFLVYGYFCIWHLPHILN